MSALPFHLTRFPILAVLLQCQWLLLVADSASLSLISDKEALVSFKSQLNLEPPSPLSSWNQNSSPCNWTGVICNEFGQRVISLNLSGFGLEGTISPYIGNLSFLRSLQLQDNQLRGTLPSQLGNLFRLRVLNMSFNSLEGEIPLNISKLIQLRVLDLMTNKITGRLPEQLSHLRNLQVLNLGRNRLWGEISPSISNLSSLNNLNLGTNNLTGRLPSVLGLLRNLKVLDLTINNLVGTVPPSIYNMTSLVHLALASNQLWGEIPYDVGDKLPNLLVFNFCFNKFTGKIPGSLHNLTNIHVIRMAHNLLEGHVPPGLGNLPFLQMYNIGFNKIVSSGDDGLAFITTLTNSTSLNLLAFDGNSLEGVIPESVGNLSKVLSKLYMGGNRIYGKIPISMGRLKSLTLLNLSYNSISGEIPDEIGQLEELQILGLAGNQISGSIPNSLGNLRKLNQIDLSGNELLGEIPTNFGNFQSLLSMDLSNNRLSRSIPKEVLNLPSLSSIINLSKNFLDGPLPQEVGLLENVVTIDFSDNHLSGNIPSSLKGCESLEKLFMANNKFSGPIPNTLGEMKGLEVLDLSSNQLSGSIPSDLQNLEALRSLNLSFNNLEGKIPSGGVFKNISNVHLEGNQDLCLHLGCEHSQNRARRIKFYIIIAIMAAVAVCFLIALLICIRKSKAKGIGTSELSNGKPQMISYNELRRATGNFDSENLIGSGSFGSVYKGSLIEGIDVAVKVLDVDRTGSWKSFLSECEALKNIRHRNLVKLITSCSSLDFRNREFLALVYEFLSNGSLADWIQGSKKNHENSNGLNFLQRLNIALDIACALDYLHHDCEIPIVHCDLKPDNILLDEEMTAKVGDFGLARLLLEREGNLSSISSTLVVKGSIGYIPPEYGMGEKPSTAGDVYSFGVMLLQLFTGMSPTHESFSGELNLVKWVELTFPEKMPQVLDAELRLHMNNLQFQGQTINPEAQNDCLMAMIGVGLSCTKDSPDNRISIREALRSLKNARDSLLKQVPILKTGQWS